MMNRKPETSLQEDLAILGLLSGDAKKALSEEAQDAGDGDGDADDKAPEEKKEKEDKEDKGEKKELPAFLKKKDDADGKKDAEMNYAEQLEAAWDVVRNFYNADEDENKGLTTEDLRTVIDAFAFIVESWDSDGGEPTKKPTDLPERGTGKVDLFPAGENPITDPGTKNSPVAPEKDKGSYGVRGRTKTGPEDASRGKYQGRHQSAITQAESLDTLVNELHSIKNAVHESGPSSEQLAVSENLISGFEAVRDTAGEVAARIKADLAESKEVASGDERLEASTYFEGIFNDASDILAAIAEGNVEIADATEDLNTISEDLKKGLASLKDVA